MQAPAQARHATGAQLALTILAVILSGTAYVLVTLGKTGRTPPDVGAFVAIIGVAYLLAHLVVARRAPSADPALLPCAAVLAGLGYAVIYRLDPDLAAAQFGWLLLGLGLFVLTFLVVRDHRSLDAYTYTIGLAGLGLLLLPIVPGIGRTINGARLWVSLGPLSFQPAEIGKVLIVIFLASYLNAKKELLALATRRLGPFRLPEPRYLGPLVVAWAVSLAVLFLEKDLGSSLLFFGIFVIMLWVATGRATYLVLGLLLFAAGAYAGYLAFDHVQLRVDVWLNALRPDLIHDQGYGQLAQSVFALGTGGIAGTGLGQGNPGLIPFAPTDFIFSALGEELGLFGTTAVLLLFLVLIGRGFRAALAREDGFSRLLAVGLTSVLALQTFVIVGGVTRLIPLTGITLPFVSYGGSSLVANFVLLALLIQASAVGPGREPRGGRHRFAQARAAGPVEGSADTTVVNPGSEPA
ncbi:MAG: FtsW/RodA/SpoVE family cell cycle protein [Actinobacteria bacterium]|nr:FtsW/RodA/SpoVE family cell cycle protein [Actinomycetota bacterium]